MHAVKFGLFLPTGDFAAAKQVALRAENDGFYSVSINDHFFSPLGAPQVPQLECFTTLTAVAAVTSRIRLTPTVAAASFRPPPLLAKMTATLDHVSNGRLTLGLGAGWQQSEYDAHGYAYPSNAERLAQMAEAIQVIKAMWTQPEPTFHGQYYSIDKAYNNPRPAQQPRPPLMLGGSGSGLLKIAAAEADILNIIPPIFNGKDFVNDPVATVAFDMTQLERRIGMFRTYVGEVGRDPHSIELGGMAMLCLSNTTDDPLFGKIASRLGFPDVETAHRSPLLCMGTPDEVRRDLTMRIEDLGITYFILIPASADSQALFVQHVMPEFVSR